jgi:hemerythrin superfamily protein
MSKTIKDQTVEELGGSSSILVRQRREHREMDELIDQYLTLDDLQRRERVLKQIVQLVFSHAFAEETVLWPAVRASVPDGEELTARVEQEHQQINDLVADVERLPAGDAGREDKVRRAFALIRQDIRDEEDLLLPGCRTRRTPPDCAHSAPPGRRYVRPPRRIRTPSSPGALPGTPCSAYH